jgi:hypothetical protein
MSTGSNIRHSRDGGQAGGARQDWPGDMVRAGHTDPEAPWMETTIRSVAESLEDYAREKPLQFAAWALGIGFILGWKLKPW